MEGSATASYAGPFAAALGQTGSRRPGKGLRQNLAHGGRFPAADAKRVSAFEPNGSSVATNMQSTFSRGWKAGITGIHAF